MRDRALMSLAGLIWRAWKVAWRVKARQGIIYPWPRYVQVALDERADL